MSITLRDYQERILGQVVECYEEKGMGTIMIVAPTGSGKSIMGMEVARHFWQSRGWKTNWMAMRRKLLSQILDLQEEHYPEDREQGFLTPVSMFDKHPPKAEVTIADESHHDACASAALQHAVVKPELIVGLSATPQRTDLYRLAFQKTIQDAGIHRLISQGWLSQFNHWNIPQYDPETVAHFYLADRERWGKTVVYFLSIQDCYSFQQLLAGAGVRCSVISSRLPEAERDARLEEFEQGDVDIVANVFVLSEGYDFPGLKTLFLRDSSRLPSIQMGGRVLRLHPTKAEGANIVQSVNTHWPFSRTANPRMTYLWKENQWLTLTGKSEKVLAACQKTVQAFSTSPGTKLPKILLEAMRKRETRVWRRNPRTRVF